MPKVEIGIGEYVDRATILQIKMDHGLNVHKEILQYNLEEYKDIQYFFNILKSINEQLWNLEEKKRNNLHDGDYLIAPLNDLRSHIKRMIDDLWQSDIKEVKSYGSTLET